MLEWGKSTMKIYQVDSFTDKPFLGNPAGVCLLDEPRSDDFVRSVAAEMNLSETAFLLTEEGGAFRLRWFTPTTEVSLCGHATLASAHILWTEGYLSPGEEARFDTMSGRLTAKKKSDWIEMDFPLRQVTPTEPPERLLTALGVRPIYTGIRRKPDGDTYLIEVESEDLVASLTPDFRLMAQTGARSVIVTSKAEGKQYDFVSRFFAPAVGIDEDPVTGSAHCYLAPHWAEKLGKRELTGFQVSKRTGVVRCCPQGDRVLIAGQAVTVLRAELVV